MKKWLKRFGLDSNSLKEDMLNPSSFKLDGVNSEFKLKPFFQSEFEQPKIENNPFKFDRLTPDVDKRIFLGRNNKELYIGKNKELGPVNFGFYGDKYKAREYIDLARRLLGNMKNRMGLSGIGYDRAHYNDDSGLEITVTSNSGIDSALIKVPEFVSGFADIEKAIGFVVIVTPDDESEYFRDMYIECTEPGTDKFLTYQHFDHTIDYEDDPDYAYNGYPDDGLKYFVSTEDEDVLDVLATDQSISYIYTADDGPYDIVYQDCSNDTILNWVSHNKHM